MISSFDQAFKNMSLSDKAAVGPLLARRWPDVDGEIDCIDFDCNFDIGSMGVFFLEPASVIWASRGTVQSFRYITRGRPVIDVRTHSIECSAHQVCAIALFCSSVIETSSFFRWKPAACACRRETPIIYHALCPNVSGE
jgi:hypothetical protein